MQNRAQMKESKCAKDILKCANETVTNNRTVPLITDDFLLFVTKIYVLKAV